MIIRENKDIASFLAFLEEKELPHERKCLTASSFKHFNEGDGSRFLNEI